MKEFKTAKAVEKSGRELEQSKYLVKNPESQQKVKSNLASTNRSLNLKARSRFTRSRRETRPKGRYLQENQSVELEITTNKQFISPIFLVKSQMEITGSFS